MHARHRLVKSLGIIRLAFVIAIDAEPMHLAPARHFGLADDRTSVFRLAGDHAGVAADARAGVDRHAPGVAFVLEAGIERLRRMLLLARKVRALTIFLERRRAHEIASFHVVMVLHARESVFPAALAHDQSRPLPWRDGGPQLIRSEEHTSALQSLAYLVCRL